MKIIAGVFGLVIAALVGWYEISPRYTLGEMRQAAAAGNGAKLSKWVDYEALKIDLKGEIRRELLIEANRRGVQHNPGVRLSVESIPERGKDGAAVFRRDGFGWKLAGVDMPYRFATSTPAP